MKIIKLSILLLLISCSSNNWECKGLKNGIPCRSISSADNTESKHQNNKRYFDKNFLLGIKQNIIVDDPAPTRSKEQVGRILIAPYVDKRGNYNSAKFIYVIDKSPQWKIN